MNASRLSASSCLALSLLVIAQSASADLWDVLDGDVKAMEKSQMTDAQQDAALRIEAVREGSDELFPPLPLETKSSLELRREERIGDFVTVTVDGRVIALHDVPLKEWFAPYVRVMAERGVITGYRDAAGIPLGEFRPANPVSVEELAKILVSLTAGIGADCPPASRNATASGSWSTQFMACAEARQWVVYSDATVDAKRPALRSEVMMTVMQAYKVNPGDAKGGVFQDVQVSMQFAAAIEKAHADGIVIGYTDSEGNALGTFGPSDQVTRAELAKILTLADAAYGQK
jgi:hypothetical protein